VGQRFHRRARPAGRRPDLAGNKTSTPVGAIGIDSQVRPDLRLGAFLGAGFGRLAVDLGSQGVDNGFPVRRRLRPVRLAAQFFDFAVSAGHTKNSSSRLVAKQLGTCRPGICARELQRLYVSPEAAFGHRFWLWHGIQVTPVARVRYVAVSYDGLLRSLARRRTSSSAAGTIQDLEERLELQLSTRPTSSAGHDSLKTTVQAGVRACSVLGDTTVEYGAAWSEPRLRPPGKDSVRGAMPASGFDYRT